MHKRKGFVSTKVLLFTLLAVCTLATIGCGRTQAAAPPPANYFAGELGLAQAQLNELLGLVRIYRNLGGGWQE